MSNTGNDLWGIVRKKDKNLTIDSENAYYELPYYKGVDYFGCLDNYVKFVKGVEKLVRQHDDYKRYIAYLKNDVGLNFCAVLGNVTENPEIDKSGRILEMHHGPILTLFDCAAIIVDNCIENNQSVSTPIIADTLLDEHFNNNIQIVMLCKTVHQAVHDFNGPFLNIKQAFGNLNAFLSKYHKGLHEDQKKKINNYIELSRKYDSFDKDLFTLEKNMIKWNKNSELEFI